ncbi:hypothetical protein CZ809_02999 [Photobacterium piscicola]|uniref:Uncharacterized protein n=1 Tax=Photobacterium piscicola TaxID=1378299 RepID=A0A1T5I312_9GAMM|nr:tetratricopeptide repeat protein [Photobacterium piscicola]SKC33412.1 hypothetical protein CZ809_02999 [Photobacterium piscicola]
MSELNRRLSALTQQSTVEPRVLQAATIEPLPNKRMRYGTAMIFMVIILLSVGGILYWLRFSVVSVSISSIAALPAISTPSTPPITAVVSTNAVVSTPKQTQQEGKTLPPQISKSAAADLKILAAMPIAEPALDSLDIKQELASSYEQGYDSGYQQALAEQQATIDTPVSSSPKDVAVTPKRKVGRLSIETVALTPAQLAMVEYNKAEKVLRQANSRQAIVHLEAALKYRPEWVVARQKLAALYYGRGDKRQAVAMLQQGLQRQPHNTELRLTLAKLLVNEQQPQAALTVLEQPQNVDTVAFLAMRAALAQQLQNTALALSSYQQLVLHDAADGRWWLGLAIAQERSQQFMAALTSYRQGAVHGGLSAASQQFIQQRIMALQIKRR